MRCLTDEKFVARAKQTSNSPRTDQSLKRVSSEQVDRLREANAEELDGTNGNPRERAEQEYARSSASRSARAGDTRKRVLDQGRPCGSFKRHDANVAWSKRGADGHARGR